MLEWNSTRNEELSQPTQLSNQIEKKDFFNLVHNVEYSDYFSSCLTRLWHAG